MTLHRWHCKLRAGNSESSWFLMSKHDVSSLIGVAEAIKIIDAAPVSPRIERVKLAAAQGRRLAAEVRADRDAPPLDKSQMDGYAVRSADVTAEAAQLRFVGEIAAGQVPGEPLRAGQTIAIMTGAPLPPGTDAVIPVEFSEKSDGGTVVFKAPAIPAKYIAKRGSEYRAGDLLLRRSTQLNAPQLALAAAVGAAEVSVFARPQVAILSTGDELVPLDQSPAVGQIRNSNSIMLEALVRRLGCDVTDLGIVRDDRDLIRRRIDDAMARCDALLVTGGMSMGEHDYVPRILRELGLELLISKVRIKPGKPFVFGMKAGRFVFGLPGNPVSGFACTLRMCSRLLIRLGGGIPRDSLRTAPLAAPLDVNGSREFYQPAAFDPDGKIRPLPWKSSADVYTLCMADALLVRAENEPAMPAGAPAKFLEIPS